MTKLAKIEEVTAVQVYEEGKMDPLLTDIEKEVRSFIPVLDTAAGRKDIASLSYKVARSKTFLDDLGKGVIEKSMETVNAVNEERKKMRDRLDALKTEARKPLTDWEDKEAERIQKINDELDRLKSFSGAVNDEGLPYTSVEMSNRLLCLTNIEIDKSFGDHEEFAAKLKSEQMEKIKFIITCLEKSEAEKVELDRLRIEKEKREEADRLAAEKKADEERRVKEAAEEEARIEAAKLQEAERVRKEAEEKARLENERILKEKVEAERKHKEELERKEKEKQDEIDRLKKEQEEKEKKAEAVRLEKARLQSEAAEKDRLEKEEAARKEKLRQENEEHRAKVNDNILAALDKRVDIEESLGLILIEEINAGHIPNVTIKY
jgi:hypothetical protein